MYLWFNYLDFFGPPWTSQVCLLAKLTNTHVLLFFTAATLHNGLLTYYVGWEKGGAKRWRLLTRGQEVSQMMLETPKIGGHNMCIALKLECAQFWCSTVYQASLYSLQYTCTTFFGLLWLFLHYWVLGPPCTSCIVHCTLVQHTVQLLRNRCSDTTPSLTHLSFTLNTTWWSW